MQVLKNKLLGGHNGIFDINDPKGKENIYLKY